MKIIGKIGKINIAANKRLKTLYEGLGVTSCEIQLEGCDNWFLQFAHRHKRIWYRSQPEQLSEHKQTVLACNHCHQIIEKDSGLTGEIFERLRGPENIDKTTPPMS